MFWRQLVDVVQRQLITFHTHIEAKWTVILRGDIISLQCVYLFTFIIQLGVRRLYLFFKLLVVMVFVYIINVHCESGYYGSLIEFTLTIFSSINIKSAVTNIYTRTFNELQKR